MPTTERESLVKWIKELEGRLSKTTGRVKQKELVGKIKRARWVMSEMDERNDVDETQDDASSRRQ